jgi:hypothetical protein
MKYLILIFLPITFLSFSILNNTEAEPEPAKKEKSKLKQRWSFDELAELIKDEFPESKKTFLTISFTRTGNRVDPVEAEFLIPSRFFEDSLDLELFQKRLVNVKNKMEGWSGCEEITIGDSKEYAWSKWKDKVVTKVTLEFRIGC